MLLPSPLLAGVFVVNLLPTHIMIIKMFKATMTIYHPSCYYYTWQYLPTLPPSLLLLHVAAWAARYSPNYDGALAILLQPSFMMWKVMILALVFLLRPTQLSTIPATVHNSRSLSPMYG